MAKTKKKVRQLKNRVAALEAFVTDHLIVNHGYVEREDGMLVGQTEVKTLEAVADNG